MRIGITGTPGTGKTTAAHHLNHEFIDLGDYARKKGLGEPGKEFKVDVEALNESLPEDCWVEGHLAHKIDLDHCIVLRTDPKILRERLEKRGYPEKKIEENVEAEAMDLILSEASKRHKVYEIDTTGRKPVEVAEEIE